MRVLYKNSTTVGIYFKTAIKLVPFTLRIVSQTVEYFLTVLSPYFL